MALASLRHGTHPPGPAVDPLGVLAGWSEAFDRQTSRRRMTPPAPRGRSPIRRRASRTALVAAIACGLCATAIPASANADDQNKLPNAFAEQRPQGKPKPRAEHAKPDAGFKALT